VWRHYTPSTIPWCLVGCHPWAFPRLAGRFALFLTALLTLIGFSVHDDIVGLRPYPVKFQYLPPVDFETVVNHSIVQPWTGRSIPVDRHDHPSGAGPLRRRHHPSFCGILLIGVFSGTILHFQCLPILVVWENKEWRNWFPPERETVTTLP